MRIVPLVLLVVLALQAIVIAENVTGTQPDYFRLILEDAGVANPYSDVEMQALAERTLVVRGASMSASERTMEVAVKLQYPFIKNATYVDDSDNSLKLIESGNYSLVIVLGGPSQNRIAAKLQDMGWQSEDIEGNTIADAMEMKYGRYSNVPVLLVSDSKGFENQPRESVNYSPLALVMPAAYVPAAATLLAVIMLALREIILSVLENNVQDMGKKGRKVGENPWLVFGINVKEPISIIAAAMLLSLAMSWQYFGPTLDFVIWFFINILVCGFAIFSHEIMHRIAGILLKVQVEYRFWKAGSVLTVISAFLGNVFGTQGFLLESIPEGTAKWKVGLMKLSGPVVSWAVMMLFALINLVFPHALFQMTYTASAVFAMSEILPVRGMDGKDVLDWNIFVWLISFLTIAAGYVLVMFIL